MRLVATIEQGWRTATDVLERFGSAARGDRIYRSAHSLSQLLRTVSIGPVGNSHINFRGTFRFPVDRYAERLVPRAA
jgi:hypothetical protein